MVPGILHQDVRDNLDEGVTVLNSGAVADESRVAQELRHV